MCVLCGEPGHIPTVMWLMTAPLSCAVWWRPGWVRGSSYIDLVHQCGGLTLYIHLYSFAVRRRCCIVTFGPGPQTQASAIVLAFPPPCRVLLFGLNFSWLGYSASLGWVVGILGLGTCACFCVCVRVCVCVC